MKPDSEIINCIKDRLKQQANPDGTLERGKLITTLGLIYRFPKEKRNDIIKELESKGAIVIVSKFEVKIV